MNSTLKRILAQFGIRNSYDQERHKTYTRLKKGLGQVLPQHDPSTCEVIIFSKDRAMQLDALLRSYYHYCADPIPVKILYHASKPEFKSSYDEVQELYADREIAFHEEEHFRQDLIELFRSLTCAKVLFLVDDVLFKKKIDLKRFTSIDTKRFIPCLRLGQHLTQAYTLQRSQALPEFLSQDQYPGLLCWDWSKGDGDWEYPLSVDGNLFDKEEMGVLVEGLDYKAPNSFEEALQLLNPYFLDRKGLCYPESIIVNNPCNKVQKENENVSGEISIAELNEKWEAGYRIDFEQFQDLLNSSAHQELAYRFVKR